MMNLQNPVRLLMVSLLLFCSVNPALAQSDTLLTAMQKELSRSLEKMKTTGNAPLYYLAYRVYDTDSIDISASYGALESHECPNHDRKLQIELRVGTPHIDSTHRLRGGGYYFGTDSSIDMQFATALPLDNDEDAIRVALWSNTDSAFKDAQDRFARLSANKAVKVEEEDNSDDFSQEKPTIDVQQNQPSLNIDVPQFESRMRALSAIFKSHPKIATSSVSLTAKCRRRYLVTSEGTKIADGSSRYRIDCKASAISDDGMRVELYDYVEAPSANELPDDAKLSAMVTKLANSLDALQVAHVAEPYTGPAILRGRAAAVYFHEILGHRLEGHRQRDEGEGKTFAKKLGQKILPDMISLVDDPTINHIGLKHLVGDYKYDDEGIPAQKAVLVDHGILKGFLMGRSPVAGFANSNGHGRAEEGKAPVSRQGNLLVQASRRVPYSQLRQMLIDEAKSQHKPYGLIFDEISGGFTSTAASLPQLFELKPLSVTRVWADGRPDELLRGVNLIGTPLASLETIVAAADDDDTFNGVCGAESGWIPVSAVAPSLLVQKIEVEREAKAQEKSPLLPPPPEAPPSTGNNKEHQ